MSPSSVTHCSIMWVTSTYLEIALLHALRVFFTVGNYKASSWRTPSEIIFPISVLLCSQRFFDTVSYFFLNLAVSF